MEAQAEIEKELGNPPESVAAEKDLAPNPAPRRLEFADVAIVLIALGLRLWALGIKPAHFDEGINGWFVDQMRSTGYYTYDPAGYHGPLYFYVLFVSLSLFGRDLIALRLPAVFASVLSVAVVLGFRNVLPKRACQMAGLCMAVSPAFVFYGRYSIHENWLLLSLLISLWGLFNLWREGSRSGLWTLGLGITGMVLLKETYVVHAGCLILAGVTLRFLERSSPSRPTDPFAVAKWTVDDLIAVCAVGIGAILFFYSGTFLNWDGVAGLILTFGEWFKTGLKGDHRKEFEYFVTLAAQFEWPALLGMAAGMRYIFSSPRKPRYLAIYGAGALFAYSLIIYKTPWCIIVILWPFYLLLGTVVDELQSRGRWFGLLWILPAVGIGASVWQTVDLNFRRFVDEEHPYVYVQTLPQISEITTPLEVLRKGAPEALHISGNIMMESSFPLPWLLGEFDRFGYYPKKKKVTSLDVAVLVVDDNRVWEVEPSLTEAYFTGRVLVRPGVSAKYYLRETEFRRVFPGREPEFKPQPPPSGDSVEVRRAIPVK